MEIAIPIVLGLIILFVVVVGVLGAMARNANEKKAAIEDPRVETLRYPVPTGQDPAVLMGALKHARHEATSEPSAHGHDLLIACPPGKREEIRQVIADADTTSVEGTGPKFDPGPIRFADE